MARLALLLAALLLLAGTAMAAPKDDKVFDSLFGAEPERHVAGATAQAGRDDLTIVELLIGTHVLSDTMLAFAGENGPCLPVDTTFDALELDHHLEGDVIVIQLHAPERRILSIRPCLARRCDRRPKAPALISTPGVASCR